MVYKEWKLCVDKSVRFDGWPNAKFTDMVSRAHTITLRSVRWVFFLY